METSIRCNTCGGKSAVSRYGLICADCKRPIVTVTGNGSTITINQRTGEISIIA